MKKAIVIGSTGLVGTHLLQYLLQDNYFSEIHSFSRNPTGIIHPKLSEHLVNFNNINDWKVEIKGDILFSAMGTTIKKAGSKSAQYLVDYTYQFEFAKAASENNVDTYALVSAAFANPKSMFFYSQIKGKLENSILNLPFKKIIILRPGLIAGKRKEKRAMETASYPLFKFISKLPGLKMLEPVQGHEVAKALIYASRKEGRKVERYTLNQIKLLTKEKH